MKAPLVPTVDFSPAKAGLSELMDDVFHRHRLQVISRHHGKEQMLLIRPEDLVAMVADQRFDVRAVYDGGRSPCAFPNSGYSDSATPSTPPPRTSSPSCGCMSSGSSRTHRGTSLVGRAAPRDAALRAGRERMSSAPCWASARASPGGRRRRALRTPDWDEVRAFLRYDRWEPDRAPSTDHDYFVKSTAQRRDLGHEGLTLGCEDDEDGTLQGDPLRPAPRQRSSVLGRRSPEGTGRTALPRA